LTIVGELIQKCVDDSAHTARDQEKYLEEYEGLVKRFETVKAEFDEVAIKGRRKEINVIH